MAELNTDGGGGHGKGGKKRAKKQSTKVDMTPLVDLAFLLLTFFVLTSTFSQPKKLEMVFPEKKPPIDKKAVEIKDGHTILLTKNNEVYYYRGQLKPETELVSTDLSSKGLRRILIKANKKLIKARLDIQERRDKVKESDTAKLNALDREEKKVKTDVNIRQTVIIKNDGEATYRNMIDVLDELAISGIVSYFPSEDGFLPLEVKLIEAKRKEIAEGGTPNE